MLLSFYPLIFEVHMHKVRGQSGAGGGNGGGGEHRGEAQFFLVEHGGP